jgi:hypothetical protein
MTSLSALSASSFALGRKPWPAGGITRLADAEDCRLKCSQEDIDSEISVCQLGALDILSQKAVIVAIPVAEGSMQV